MKCDKCQHENREGVKFCENCGEPISQPCPSCGHINRPGVKFCEKCGAAYQVAKKTKTKRTKTGARKSHRKRRSWLWGLVGGLLAILLCLVAYVLLPAPPATGDTTLPDFIDNTWSDVVRGRNYYADQGGMFGTVVDNIQEIVGYRPAPQPKKPGGAKEAIVEEEDLPDFSSSTGCPELIYDAWEPDALDKHWAIDDACEQQGGTFNQINVGGTLYNVCMCPTGKAVKDTCDWVNEDIGLQYSIECDFRCAVHIEPLEAINQESGVGFLIKLKNGKVLSNNPLTSCSYNDVRYFCEIQDASQFDENTVENIYLCADACCLDLLELDAAQPVFNLAESSCPGLNDLSADNSAWNKGVLSFEVTNALGWPDEEITATLVDALDRDWGEIGCDKENDELIICSGGLATKTGYATMTLNIGDTDCRVEGVNVDLPSLCSDRYFYCPKQGYCCPDGTTCCASGCCK